MPSNAYRDRVFRAAEVRRILRQAVELDEAARPPNDTGRGHTLEEIERIAADAGISEAGLRRAIAGEVGPARASGRSFSFAFLPAGISVARTVEGKVGPEAHREITKAMRGAVGVLGDARSAGDALSWSSSAVGGRNVHAIVEPAGDGRVTVRVDENLRNLRGSILSGTLAAGLLAVLSVIAFIPHSVAATIVPFLLCGWVISSYLAALILYRRRFDAREAELRALIAEVVAVAGGKRARIAADLDGPREVRVGGIVEVSAEDEPDEREEGAGAARRQGP